MTSDIEPRGPAQDLATLAGLINREHRACEAALRAGLAHATAAGRLLLAAKAQVGHGGWLPWVQAHCEFSERTAQGYMRVARNIDALRAADPQRVAGLTYREALALLAEPKPAPALPAPEPLTAEERMSLAEAEATIIEAGRFVLQVARRLPDGATFARWLAAAFPGHEPLLSELMVLAIEDDPHPGRALAIAADYFLPPGASSPSGPIG